MYFNYISNENKYFLKYPCENRTTKENLWAKTMAVASLRTFHRSVTQLKKVGEHCPTCSTIFLFFKEVPPRFPENRVVVQHGI